MPNSATQRGQDWDGVQANPERTPQMQDNIEVTEMTTVKLKPLIDVSDSDVYNQFHANASSVDFDGSIVTLGVKDYDDWLKIFKRRFSDNSGDCQRYKILSHD